MLRPACIVALSALVMVLATCGTESVEPPGSPVVAAIEITTPATTLHAIDETLQLAAVARDSAGDPVASASIAWTSLAPGIIGVSGTGLATAKANGTANIVAGSGGKADTLAIALAQVVDTVVLEPSSWTATRIGQRQAFAASALDANGHAVADASYKYRSSDETVASVDSAGIVTARRAGSASLAAYAEADDSALAELAVDIAPPGGDGVVYTLFPARSDSSPVVLLNGSLRFNQTTYGTLQPPTSPWQGAAVIGRFAWSRDNIGVITDMAGGQGTLWLRDRISEWALVATGDATDVKIEVSRFGWLTAGGRLRMKTDPHGPVTELDGSGVAEFQLSATRIGALKDDGTLRIKEGAIDAPWVNVASDVERFHIRGNHIGVLNGAGQFRAKVGVNDPWTVLADTGVVDFRVSTTLIGIIRSDGSLLVKEGINGTWAELASSGVEQLELEGDRIAWRLSTGEVRVKETPFGPVTNIGTGMSDVRLQGDFIGQVSTDDELSVKRGINGPREVVGTYANLQQYRLIVDVPSPPHRTSRANYVAGLDACADQAAGDFCISPYQNDPGPLPLPPLYGRWCGDGRPLDAHVDSVRKVGPLDALDQICRHHDNATVWYTDNAGAFSSCVVMYGLHHARLTQDGSLIPRGTGEYDQTFGANMARLHAATEAYWDFTSVCTPGELDEFTAAMAATH